ncbi:saccharopine dehydrogenase NADP-binding domain-containing protein [Candidatus Obscuribacterales bacterium]|nr:saccharopine dehydrogenase NADP-binding domain-containing protein [Candidatus Obscuribacterales bacterium]
MRIVVFGGGMQGRVIARNLAARDEKPEVIIADLNEVAGLESTIKSVKANVLNKEEVGNVLKGADAAVLAVPSSIAHDALRNLIETGVAIVDVSFTPDPPLSLNAEAVKSGSCVVVDCGVAPGLSHLLVGRAYAELGGLDKVRILVGGMAQNPPPVFHHAVYFNASDLLAEYVRPARARISGKDIAPNPFDAPIEQHQDHEAGRLDAFLSDGLRSLLDSYPDVPDMVERTLRLDGHMETMRRLNELGLFDDDSIHATAKKLGSKYSADKYPDFLLMVVEATRGNKTLAWRLMDRATNCESAMSRTTGYTTAAMAMVLAKKQFAKPGVFAPEKVGEETGIAQIIVDDLKERGVKTEAVEATLGAPTR